MKRFLLLISAMLVMGSMIAQDVYSSGYYTDTDGQTKATVYKNGERINTQAIGSGTNTSESVVVDSQDNVYWVRNSENYGDVFKNSDYYLNNNTGTHVNDLFIGEDGTVYSAGYKTVSGVRTAVLWGGTSSTPLYTYGDGTYDSEASCGMFAEGQCFVGGWQTTATSTHGAIWTVDSFPYFVYPDGTYVLDISYYNGTFYALVVDENNDDLLVYENNTVMYTLVSGNSSNRGKLVVDCDDVYVVSYGGNSPDVLWMNGEQLDETPSYFMGLTATTSGVYYCGSENGAKIWKDGNELYTVTDCDRMLDVFVPEVCTNSSALGLPYYENFDRGNTGWNCWTITDEGDGGLYGSFWHRSDYIYHDGDIQAEHYYGCNGDQEGWLISPQISLMNVTTATLGFNTREQDVIDYEYEGVWISTTGTNPSNFTEIWTQTNPQDSWEWTEVDLSPYTGHNVYIAFKYTGDCAHIWYVDDIDITGNLGVDDVTSMNLSVYPNPAKDVIRINGLDKATEVYIYNATGALVKTVVTNGQNEINIDELAAGLYLARFQGRTLRFTKE